MAGTPCNRTKAPSYRQVQEAYRTRYSRTVKTCWIADVKRRHGKIARRAYNSSGLEPKYPCPEGVYKRLEEVMKDLGMI